jgi:hypothetical protein
MRWIELFLTVVREGLGEPVSLEFLLPHTGQERANILAEVDKVALYHYKLKVAYEAKLRRRFGRAQNAVDAEDQAAQVLVNGVVEEIGFGELIQGDVDDIAAEENSESGDDDSSDDESTSDNEDASDDSDESDDSGETTSKESIPRPRPAIRSQTIKRPPQTVPIPDAQPPALRSRSFSLRSSRSMNFALSLGRRSNPSTASPAPPVPLIPPQHKPTNSLSLKPLPPSPTSRSSTDRPPPIPSKSNHEPKKQKVKGKKASETLKPPDLHHIPQLLPVFVEMVCPAFALCARSILTFHI